MFELLQVFKIVPGTQQVCKSISYYCRIYFTKWTIITKDSKSIYTLKQATYWDKQI